MDNLNYSDKLKLYGFQKGKVELLLSYIYKKQFSLLQGKKPKKCNIASVHPVYLGGKIAQTFNFKLVNTIIIF